MERLIWGYGLRAEWKGRERARIDEAAKRREDGEPNDTQTGASEQRPTCVSTVSGACPGVEIPHSH